MTPSEGSPALIDERVALWAASIVAPSQRYDVGAVAALRAGVHDDVPRLDAAARRWSGLGADLPPATAVVVGRHGFVRANLASMRGAFDPLRQRLTQRPPGAAKVLGAQIGALLGLLSSKVLGQFVLPLGGPGGGQLLVVGPNVLQLAEEHGEVATDVRRTVVLHELVHRLQFDAVPWLGQHIRDLLARYLADVRLDSAAVADLVPRLPDIVAEARRSGSVQPILNAVLSKEQAAVLDEAQGLMSLLEGHGTAAMYDAGGDLIGDGEAVREALAARRPDAAQRILTAVAGLDMKKRQYREGETFVRAVLDEGGTDALNQAFDGPDALPTADEITDPEAWLVRVGIR